MGSHTGGVLGRGRQPVIAIVEPNTGIGFPRVMALSSHRAVVHEGGDHGVGVGGKRASRQPGTMGLVRAMRARGGGAHLIADHSNGVAAYEPRVERNLDKLAQGSGDRAIVAAVVSRGDEEVALVGEPLAIACYTDSNLAGGAARHVPVALC